MNGHDAFLTTLTARLNALIADQERLLEVIRAAKRLSWFGWTALLPLTPRLLQPADSSGIATLKAEGADSILLTRSNNARSLSHRRRLLV